MREKLIAILGLKKDTTEQEIIDKVFNLRNELDGKMGFAHSSIMAKMVRLGYFQFNEQYQMWHCRQISSEEMNKILTN